jgi:hypothetical protein
MAVEIFVNTWFTTRPYNTFWPLHKKFIFISGFTYSNRLEDLAKLQQFGHIVICQLDVPLLQRYNQKLGW